MTGSKQALVWSQLISGVGLTSVWDGPSDPLIDAVVEDSRQVAKGSCFVAVRGSQADGHAFIGQAIHNGASAVVCEKPIAAPVRVPVLMVDHTQGLAGQLSAILRGLHRVQRDGGLKVVGITGTNGKSTFCYLLRAILKQAKYPTAMLGTVEYDLLSRTISANMTTPPATALIDYLAEAHQAGATHAVMEVSSHALDQDRCSGVRFAVGVFSNLTGDHLDYHKNMDAYLRAKKRLFDQLDSDAVAVINVDDAAGERMVTDCKARILRYGIVDNTSIGTRRSTVASCLNAAIPSDQLNVSALLYECKATGTQFDVMVRDGLSGSSSGMFEMCSVNSALVGRHNVQNCLAAAAAAVALGVDLEDIAAGLQSVQCVPGRLHRVETHRDDVTVLVDYAHTDDALANVLSALRPLTQRRLIVLFGCGGDRDRQKRPRMAKVVTRYADRIVVTSDNPRTEDPKRIIDDILAGFASTDMKRVTVEPDRRQAITRAIQMASPGDVVLLAGKGHETYQVIGQNKIDFDDAAVAANILNNLARC